MTPVEMAIKEFGSIRKLALAIHRDPAAIVRWKQRGGHIPTAVQRKLLNVAWDRGIQLSAHDIVFGDGK